MSADFTIRRIDVERTNEVMALSENVIALQELLFSRFPLNTLGEETLHEINRDPGSIAAHLLKECASVGSPFDTSNDLESFAAKHPFFHAWGASDSLVHQEFDRVVPLDRAMLDELPDVAPLAESEFPDRRLEPDDVLRYLVWVRNETPHTVAFFEGSPPGLDIVKPVPGVPSAAIWAALRESQVIYYDGVRMLQGDPEDGDLPMRGRAELGGLPAIVWTDGVMGVRAFALADGSAWMIRRDPILQRMGRWVSGVKVAPYVPAETGMGPDADAAVVAARSWSSSS
jgi:hypothetical protein